MSVYFFTGSESELVARVVQNGQRDLHTIQCSLGAGVSFACLSAATAMGIDRVAVLMCAEILPGIDVSVF